METARGSVEVREPTKLEQASARRVAESKATIPHLYLDAELELTEELEGTRVTALLVKAAATALRGHPLLNGAYRDGRFEAYSRVNVGVAVPAKGVPVVPTVFDADSLEVDEIAARLTELAEAARSGELTSPQLAGGTFTITVVESPAVERVTPVVTAGQAAILGVGGVREAPIVHEGEVRAGRLINVTLACDHRIVGASEGTAFLEALKASFSGLR